MANQVLTSTIITKEALRLLTNSLTAWKTINKKYEDEFNGKGAKKGQSLNIRKPPRYIVSEGTALAIQDAREEFDTLVIEKQYHIDLSFGSAELALSVEDFSDQFLKPAVPQLANAIDSYVLSFYDQIYQAVGTPGTVPNTLLTYLQAGVKLSDAATPRDGLRSVILNPEQEATIIDALKGLFHQGRQISEQYTSGMMGTAVGFDWHMDQNLPVHTYGTYAGTPLVNTADQVGSSLITDGWSSGASTLNRGDIFTISGVYMVNPMSRRNNGKLQQFRVVNTVSDTTGDMTITIDPPIVISGPTQNVTNSPANNAPITVRGATGVISPQAIAWHRDALTAACVDLPLPRGADMASRMVDKQLGVSLRLWRDGDIFTDTFPTRLDVLLGAKLLRPEMAARIEG